MCSFEGCDLEKFKDSDKCILHCKKDNELLNQEINLFYFRLKEKTEVKEANFPVGNTIKLNEFLSEVRTNFVLKKCEFNQKIECLNDKIIFNECVFNNHIAITNKILNKNQVCFSNCTFNSSLAFYGVTISRTIFANCSFSINKKIPITFVECDFYKNPFMISDMARDIIIKDSDFHNIELNYKNSNFISNFELLNCKAINLIDFSKSKFEKNSKVKIKECEIQNANFYNTTFNNLVDFYKTDFKEVNFNKTDFNDIVVFTETIFNCNANFKFTTFNKLGIFRKTVFKKKLNLIDSIFNVYPNFLESSSCEVKVEKLDLDNRETARIIKDSFEQQNNIIEANKFYAIEMEKREKELNQERKEGKNFLDWIVFKVHKHSSNHSQDWSLSLFWIMMIGFISSYCDFNFMKVNGTYIHFDILNILKTLGLVSLMFILSYICEVKDKIVNGVYYLVSIYLIYIYSTEDYLLTLFAKAVNPSTVLKSNDPVNGIQLIFKIIIAYLIYQFVISVRQNTRRK